MSIGRYLTRLGKQKVNVSALSRLRRDKRGTVTYLGIVLVILVLVFSGFAVDLMRLESKRVTLQSAVDRGVLAAADVDQVRDRQQVVRDYMQAAGLDNTLVGDPKLGGPGEGVSAVAELQIRPIFGNLAKDVTVQVGSQAVNREAEISLVLDISGSMAQWSTDRWGYRTDNRKIDDLRIAASAFLDILLTDDVRDRVSISIVPYSEQVNIGPDLFALVSSTRQHTYSYCLDFNDAAFTSTVFDTTKTYEQVPPVQLHASRYRWQYYYGYGYVQVPVYERDDLNNPICPKQSYEQIMTYSQDKAALQARIRQLQPRGSTSIHLGMKWGAVLLDPQNAFLSQGLNRAGKLDTAFVDRPLAFGNPQVLKAIVLMTDGENFPSRRPYPEHTDEDAEIERWARNNFGWWWRRRGYDPDRQAYQLYSSADANRMMHNICEAAKDAGIVVYGVAVELSAGGRAPMEDCVTSPAHFFAVNGSQLESVFVQIAQDIKSLRLAR